MFNLKKHNRKIKFKPKLVLGVLVTIFSALLLIFLGIFFWQKYSAPTPLAELLPSADTLFFFELKTEELESQELKQIFTETSVAELLELNSLGLAEQERLFDFTDQRVGIAFFGPNPDPKRFLLVIDTIEPANALNFLENQTLGNEKLKTENYLHQKIYSYPQSYNFAFTFDGSDLLIASNVEDLKKVTTAIHIPEKRISATPEYRAVIAKMNPRAKNFGYLSPSFIQQVLSAQFGGLKQALALPILNLWQSGGITLAANENGLKIETRLILKNEHVRKKIFLESKKFNIEILNLLGPEINSFWAINNAQGQIEHFLKKGQSFNSAFSLLASGTINKITHDWLDSEIDFSANLAPLFTSNTLLGFTDSGETIGIFTGASVITHFEGLKEKLLLASGKIAGREKNFTLPDDTYGREIIVEEGTAFEKIINYEGLNISQLKFPRYEINSITLGDNLIVTTELQALKNLIDRFTGKDKNNFSDLLKLGDTPAKNLRYSRIAENEVPFLRPFQYSLASLDLKEDEIALEIFLGK